MKPTIFLSHSKRDKDMIERLANDLRIARINVWYDEWEIPPGISFRNQIFEEGIPNCDLFFVYLSSSSVQSYWVGRELDAAYVRDAEVKGGLLALFVDSAETRSTMSLDLQALNSPVLNEETYNRALYQLISRAWEGKIKKKLRDVEFKHQFEIMQLKTELSTLQLNLTEIRASEGRDLLKTINFLTINELNFGEHTVGYIEVFKALVHHLAVGCSLHHIENKLKEYYQLGDFPVLKVAVDFLGTLIIHGMVRVDITPDNPDYYYLTDFGSKVILKLNS